MKHPTWMRILEPARKASTVEPSLIGLTAFPDPVEVAPVPQTAAQGIAQRESSLAILPTQPLPTATTMDQKVHLLRSMHLSDEHSKFRQIWRKDPPCIVLQPAAAKLDFREP
jgi:hypothetical protein